MMKKQKTRISKQYSIGYSSTLKCYILACTVQWILWYDRYFHISEEEYYLSEGNVTALDRIANQCYAQGTSSSRFICSEKKDENTPEQTSQLTLLKESFVEYDRKRECFI